MASRRHDHIMISTTDSGATSATRAKVVWQKATSIGSCRYLLSCHGRHLGSLIITAMYSDVKHTYTHILGLIEPEIAPFDPPTPKTPPYRTKHEVDWNGSPVAEIWSFEIRHITRDTFGTPILRKEGGRMGSSIIPFERAMAVSYTLSIVTIALSLTILPEFAIECLRRSIRQGVGGPLWAKI